MALSGDSYQEIEVGDILEESLCLAIVPRDRKLNHEQFSAAFAKSHHFQKRRKRPESRSEQTPHKTSTPKPGVSSVLLDH